MLRTRRSAPIAESAASCATGTVGPDDRRVYRLYVDEIGSEDVRNLVSRAAVVATAIVAYPETRVALARLRRSRDLVPANFSAVKRSFERQWPAFLALEVSAPLSREAGDFAERYALCGYDALHLASFAEIARRAGLSKRVFRASMIG
jgi:uncharacterized protein